ncbi:MAG: glycosyltransferase, partial [Acidobacteriota bacterium]|nr:glycosyltransferase [Acidobacteriota bacterium]
MVRVSVVCTYLNSISFLVESIDSVLRQSFTDWELLLVDDGSIDGSHAVAELYANRYSGRIIPLHHPGRTNRGISSSRNLGIRHSQGELIALIDSDDVWLPDMLRTQ